jgi:PKD repeat protein
MTGFPSAPRNFAAINNFGSDVASAAIPATLPNSLIVAGFSAQLASGVIPSVTDSAGNQLAMAPLLTPGVSQRHGEIWWIQVPAGGVTGVTVHNGSTSVNVAGVVAEWPVDKPVRLRDTASRANAGSQTPPAAAAIAAIGDLVFGIIAYQATVASTQQEHLVGSVFTTLSRVTRGTTSMFASAYDIAGAAGATGPSWTLDAVIATGEVTAAFTLAPVFSASTAGLTASFDASGSTLAGGDPVVSYAWDFGDGSTGSGVSPSHDYGSAGVKTVTLTATYSSGDTGTTTLAVTVTAPASVVRPIALVSASGYTVVGAGGDPVAAVSAHPRVPSAYVVSPVNPNGAPARYRLPAIETPAAGTDLSVTVYCRVVGGTGTLSAKLYQGGTVRATAAAQTLAVGTDGADLNTLLTFTFAAADIANVTSWNALDIEVISTATG